MLADSGARIPALTSHSGVTQLPGTVEAGGKLVHVLYLPHSLR